MKNLIQRGKEAALKVWTSRTMGIGAGLLLLLIVGLVATSVVLAFMAPQDKNQEAAPEPAEVSDVAASSSASAPAPDGKCNVPVEGTSLHPDLPKDLRWAASKGLSWPVSDSTGPTQEDDGHPTCFARSPLGAGLFAASFYYNVWVSGDIRASSAYYAEDAAGRAEVMSMPKTSGGRDDVLDGGWSAAGFSVDYFANDQAQVRIILRAPSSPTGYLGFPLSLVWANDDWKIDTAFFSTTFETTTPSKGDFVEWEK